MNRDAGFTLIELMIALALFGLIAVAGLSLVDSTLGIQAGTRGRLDRLAELRRTFFLVGADITQVDAGPITGGADRIAFRRHNRGDVSQSVPIAYALAGGTLARRAGRSDAQPLLTGVASARWRFYDQQGGWIDRWPPATDAETAKRWPAAVELTLALAPGRGRPAGTLRRVVVLPARP